MCHQMCIRDRLHLFGKYKPRFDNAARCHGLPGHRAVSYTHLDVYKRQVIGLLVQILEVRFISTPHSDFLS